MLNEDHLLTILYKLQQAELGERDTLDAVARGRLLDAIEEVQCEVEQREGERARFAGSWGQWHEVR